MEIFVTSLKWDVSITAFVCKDSRTTETCHSSWYLSNFLDPSVQDRAHRPMRLWHQTLHKFSTPLSWSVIRFSGDYLATTVVNRRGRSAVVPDDVLCVRPSIDKRHWTNFRIPHFGFLLQSVCMFRFWLKSDKNNGHLH
jgi:hypothetical protein